MGNEFDPHCVGHVKTSLLECVLSQEQIMELVYLWRKCLVLVTNSYKSVAAIINYSGFCPE